jgi:hypothetical protein
MIHLHRLLALLTPSPFAGFVSILTALGAGYLLWTELEPAPRHVAPFDASSWRRVSFSPDGKSIVFWLETFDPRGEDPRQITFSILDLDANKEIVFAETTDRPIVFAPDGKRVAGIRQDAVYIWDRETGAELNRYPLKMPIRKRFERRLAFMPEGLILWNALIFDEIDNAPIHMITLNDGKPWNGAKKAFDQISDAQQLSRLTNRISADGNHSVSDGKTGVVVSDWRDNSSKLIPLPWRFESASIAGISPDAKTLLVHGKVWRPLHTAIDSIKWAYSEAKDPAAAEGVLLLDVESGAEIAFLQNRSQFGVAPDGKSFVSMNRSEGVLRIYDWPLAKPWWHIVGGTLLAFVSLVLISKAWRWLRGKRTPDEVDTPRTKPPWETEAETAD